MDLDKTSLIKTILHKLRVYLKSQSCDSVLNEFSEILKKCQFLKLRNLSNDLFYELESGKDNSNELIEDFKIKILKCTDETFKNHISDNSNENNENICLSSDDELESHKSVSSVNSKEDQLPVGDDQKDLCVESDDSDIEIIYAKESINGGTGGSHYNMRKRKTSNSKENINVADGERNFKQTRYEFRERKPNFSTPSTTADDKSNSAQSQKNGINEKSGGNLPRNEEVIQIEDSSSDEDVQEIHCESGGTSNGGFGAFRNDHNFRQPRNSRKPSFKVHMSSSATDHPPTQADPSQLASIPFVVQFPTMRASTFNGHLYISHNHKFSVKLQGIDPRNFRWN